LDKKAIVMEKGGSSDAQQLIEVRDLTKHFPVRSGVLQRVAAWVKAVDGVSFDIRRGEVFGLVGESGCGKTTLGRAILRLIEPTSGSVRFEGRDLLNLPRSQIKALRREMQIIFQDPYSSLDPRMRVGRSIEEGLSTHGIGTPDERWDLVMDMLRRVGLDPYHARRYPHEFSGGQRQRIGIARALILRPKFLVADEPVSALDMSVQSQVLNILKQLQKAFRLSTLFIAHNMRVVEHMSDRMGVMYLGKVVELASKQEIFARPLHPYTQALMSAIPVPSPGARKQRTILPGDVPSPMNPPSGCHFHPRCPVAVDQCSVEEPAFRESVPDHWVSCWLTP
jgi:oligopeptide/dipeptide ABC transporter ATP-binding protein